MFSSFQNWERICLVFDRLSNGYEVYFSEIFVEITRESKIFAVGYSETSNLYRLKIFSSQTKSQPMESFSALAKPTPKSFRTWHHRLGHASQSTINKMISSEMVVGLVVDKGSQESTFFCEGCTYGKQHRLPFPTTGRTRATRIGKLIHSDFCVPISTISPAGAR